MHDETMPDVLDRLVALTGQLAEKSPEPPTWELSSNRVVTRSDPDGRVEVTISDYAVRAVRIDPDYLMSGDLTALEDLIAVAATAALKRFLDEEMQEAADASSPMNEVHAQLIAMSRDVTAAYEREMSALDAQLRAL